MNILNNKQLVRSMVDSGKTIAEVIAQDNVTQSPPESGVKPMGKHILTKLYEGKNVFIRTVTHHHVGEFVLVEDGFIILTKCSWVASDGRFTQAIGKGELEEVEPFPADMLVPISVASIIDCAEWLHALPTKQK